MPSSSPIVIPGSGAWSPALTGPGTWLVTGNDNFDYCWAEAAPSAALPGHFRLARVDLVVRLLSGEQLYVRAQRPMTLTATAEA
jgi:hypothetical protein